MKPGDIPWVFPGDHAGSGGSGSGIGSRGTARFSGNGMQGNYAFSPSAGTTGNRGGVGTTAFYGGGGGDRYEGNNALTVPEFCATTTTTPRRPLREGKQRCFWGIYDFSVNGRRMVTGMKLSGTHATLKPLFSFLNTY